MRELDPSTPTWDGANDAPGIGMGGVCRDPEGQWFFWSYHFSWEMKARLVSNTNPKGDVKINDL